MNLEFQMNSFIDTMLLMLWKCYSTLQFGAPLFEEEMLKGNFELI